MIKHQLKHFIYGYHDTDLRDGPFNFRTTKEFYQLIVQDDTPGYDHVVWVGESESLESLKRAAKRTGHPAPRGLKPTVEFGGAFQRY